MKVRKEEQVVEVMSKYRSVELRERHGLSRWASYILHKDAQGEGREAIIEAIKRIDLYRNSSPVRKRKLEKDFDTSKFIYDDRGKIKGYNPNHEDF
jgi:hypothetical protein